MEVPADGGSVICPHCNSRYNVWRDESGLRLRLVDFAGLPSPDDYPGVLEFFAVPEAVASAERKLKSESEVATATLQEERAVAEYELPEAETTGKTEAVSPVVATPLVVEPSASEKPSSVRVDEAEEVTTTESVSPWQVRAISEEEEELARQRKHFKRFRSRLNRLKVGFIIGFSFAGLMLISGIIGVFALFGGYEEDLFYLCFAFPSIVFLLSLAGGLFFFIRYLSKKPLLRTLQGLLNDQERKVAELPRLKESP